MGSVSCWRDWISSLISTASTHVLLNGDLVILIYNVRCCFILLMEILHGLLMKTVQSGVLVPPANPSSAAVPDCWTDPPVEGQRLATASPSGNYMHQRLFYRKDSECCPGEYQETGSESEGKDEGPGRQYWWTSIQVGTVLFVTAALVYGKWEVKELVYGKWEVKESLFPKGNNGSSSVS